MAPALLPPGFRFHPTDEELVFYYLKRKVMGKPLRFMAIPEVELYKHAPWDLPEKSCLMTKDLEWYFFCPRDKKYPNGSRVNRSTEIGYWKTTGKDRAIVHNSRVGGMKKSLIFHTGKPPKGDRTNWVMYEYRLADDQLAASGVAQDAYVICKIFKKSGMGPKIGEQYGAPFSEEDWENDADFEATVAAFPFLPHQELTGQLSNNSNATTSIAEPLPMSVDATAVAETIPVSDAATTIMEPVAPSLAAESVAIQSAAISTGGYEELPAISGHPLGTPQCVAALPSSPEMDGLQLDDLVDLILDSPYRPGNVSGELAPQQPSQAVVNFNEAANDEANVIYSELADLTDEIPSDGNELATLGGMLASNDNAAQPLLSELGAQHYVELNDIVFNQEDDFFSHYYDPAPSPEMDIDAILSMGLSTSEPQISGSTSNCETHGWSFAEN